MGKALWRRAFDAAEGAVGPHVEDLVRHSGFSTAVVLSQRTRSWAVRAAERRTRRVWHLVNLPAGSDVQRLRRQVGDLDREVRLLREALESARTDDRQADETRGLPGGGRSGAASTGRGAGASAAGRGAQRAASP